MTDSDKTKGHSSRRTIPDGGRRPIPIYPPEGFFATTVVEHGPDDEGKGYAYTHHDYQRQHDAPPWTPRQASEAAYEALLDLGWTPEPVPQGGLIRGMVLVPPSAEVRAEMRRMAEESEAANARDEDKPNPSPGRQAVKKAAKKPSGRTQGGSEAGCYS